jgi:hypothetical protein
MDQKNRKVVIASGNWRVEIFNGLRFFVGKICVSNDYFDFDKLRYAVLRSADAKTYKRSMVLSNPKTDESATIFMWQVQDFVQFVLNLDKEY